MSNDTLRSFLIESADVRGDWVRVGSGWRDIPALADCPPVVCRWLGEAVAAALLMSQHLKDGGQLNLHLVSDAQTPELIVQVRADASFRATLRWPNDEVQRVEAEAFSSGKLSIDLMLPGALEPYRGVVALDGGSIAAAMTRYFSDSEQLQSVVFLAANADFCAGFLLQRLPAEQNAEEQDGWNRVGHLAATLSTEELLTLSSEALLQRLFHEETVRIFTPRAVAFRCGCNRNRSADLVRLLGHEEAEDILREQGSVTLTCGFCGDAQSFDAADIAWLFAGASSAPGSSRLQ